MAKEVRLNLTESERLGLQNDLNVQSFKGDSVEKLVEKENARKFNNELETLQAKFEEKNQELTTAQEDIGYDVAQASIKPMFSKILIKPFKVNPFQKLKIEGGIIVDTGGYSPHTQRNPQTGRFEEQEQYISTAAVIEVGPEVKYLKEGDVVYYQKHTALPVPFLKAGLYVIPEGAILAVVNEGLEERFEKVKND